VAHRVARHLRTVTDRLTGRIDLYPCVNPLAAHHGARNWPGFDLDLNRRFPGREDGHAPDRLAHNLVHELRACDHVIELRGAHPAFREETQAHVRVDAAESFERAMLANVRVVWRRAVPLEGSGTLMSQLPGLISLEGGLGNRLTDGVGLELGDGVLNLLVVLGARPEGDLPFHWAAIQRPVVATDDEVVRVRAERGGLFLPGMTSWAEVEAGDCLGEVVDPTSGDVRQIVTAPARGRVLAMREQPVVYPGTLVARLVTT
jgi:predicted deacylase